MRMNSAADLAGIAETFSFAPESMLAQAPYFDQGETLLAGGIVNRPTVARFGGRLSPEGGGDVPATWA
jgi:DNA helicase HerA-like ATPase